ncbi:MAG: helix-turn-helix domain-containing protein [Anaerovibrio sp.]|nr:helix-turn-helix domain-containing protein [Anaerovibrio sp.]
MGGRKGNSGWLMEILHFHMFNTSERLSASAQLLWHYLMYRANQNWWHYPLCLNLPEIAYAINISISSIKNARHELAQRGFIRWESQGGNKAAKYYVMSLTGSEYAGQRKEERTN